MGFAIGILFCLSPGFLDEIDIGVALVGQFLSFLWFWVVKVQIGLKVVSCGILPGECVRALGSGGWGRSALEYLLAGAAVSQ